MWLCALLLAAGARGTSGVDVLRLPMSLEQEYSIDINNTVEYILDFTPTSAQATWPTRVWLRVSAGDPARPALVTARQPTGAQTWQLPYLSEDGARVLLELQRTLCHDFTGEVSAGSFSLHVSSASDVTAVMRLRAEPVAWLLPSDTPALLTATQTAAGVRYYEWPEAQTSVRLALASQDDVCATLAVHNYTCPVPETAAAVSRGGLRMTVQRSGGAQLQRSQFPAGFLVVLLVAADDSPCVGSEPPAQEDWLWQAAAGASAEPSARDAEPPRLKNITLTLTAALSRGQYLAATAATLALFLGFYAAFLGLVLAQRYRPFKRLVAPKAVLAKQDGGETAPDGAADGGRARRGSDDTFDSMDDDSESDEEPRAAAAGPGRAAAVAGEPAAAPAGPDGAPAAAPAAAPFGLPPRLHLAALSRHGARTLRARSDRYLHTLYTVAVFYALPVLQFVAAFQLVLNVSGSLDLCYYNFLCAHPAGAISDFNHVFSNLGYLLLGALFLLQLRRRRRRRRRRPRDEEYGIPAHYGLLESLGAGMMVVALLSASYHVCPNQLNFQFDTAFMYVLAVLAMVKMYQARHPDINARAHSTFGVLAVLIALVVWGVLGGGALFWGVFTVLHVFTFLLLSLRIYYVGQFRLEGAALAEAARGLRSAHTLYAPRLVMLLIANAVNWAFAIYGLLTMSADFAGHLLFVLLCNTLLYMVFYLAMKLLHGERLRWYAWALLGGAAAAWAPALYFFVSGSSDWSATAALSRHLNHDCYVMSFYDSHDLWHMLSAVALYLSFNAMLTWDDGLSAVKRTEIAVF